MTSNKVSPAFARLACAGMLTALAVLAASCGGGGSASSASNGAGTSEAQAIAACGAANYPTLSVPTTGNSVPIIIDNGPCVYGVPSNAAAGTAASAYVLGAANVPYTSVKICVPGTTTCQTIDHVLVDTGSTGLRIMSSVLNSSVALPAISVTSGNSTGPLIECVQFADGYSWGSVRTADVRLAGETAASLPIEVIGDSTAYTVPAGCSGTSTNALNTAAAFGANGVLGVGLFVQDCGTNCVGTNNSGNGFYYTCPTTTTCTGYGPTLAQQVANPVASFTDNTGVVVQFPALADGTGAATLYGTLIFGVANLSTLANLNLYEASDNDVCTIGGTGYYTSGTFYSTLVSTSSGYTLPSTTEYCNSFIDSGSNGIFLPGTNIPTDTPANGSWFLPISASTNNIITILATQQGIAALTGAATGNAISLSFEIANAETVLFPSNNGNNTAFSDLGAPSGNANSAIGGVDWGMPFFFGKSVVIGLEGTQSATPIGGTVGTGPYWAY